MNCDSNSDNNDDSNINRPFVITYFHVFTNDGNSNNVTVAIINQQWMWTYDDDNDIYKKLQTSMKECNKLTVVMAKYSQ